LGAGAVPVFLSGRYCPIAMPMRSVAAAASQGASDLAPGRVGIGPHLVEWWWRRIVETALQSVQRPVDSFLVHVCS